MRDVSFRPDPDDPDMTRISFMKKVAASEMKGWPGFSSSQL